MTLHHCVASSTVQGHLHLNPFTVVVVRDQRQRVVSLAGTRELVNVETAVPRSRSASAISTGRLIKATSCIWLCWGRFVNALDHLMHWIVPLRPPVAAGVLEGNSRLNQSASCPSGLNSGHWDGDHWGADVDVGKNLALLSLPHKANPARYTRRRACNLPHAGGATEKSINSGHSARLADDLFDVTLLLLLRSFSDPDLPAQLASRSRSDALQSSFVQGA